MSPALADLPLRKVLDALKKAGFDHVRTKGSHAVYRNPAGNVVVVPQHDTVKRGTLASILRQAGLTPAEFLDLLG
ncbi:type II toxin-antitoxin system HicA family toxin [Micromonospora siamensis]|uniref:Predicted RNA binding protein YcfA, dsRBD-like fold, HicA-like mRNA interferase family n=1 Tax=Micromonospora siamensis TaxID=299152 RepID=A0A1C5K5C1_9ACTN|nr:type II toxin-antitoxin system HicA family toxin [Micromonospora siamensis]SCG77983.1 Predicted RNA binding protein YcfA, dsRBD-like fold, HicA-like mRNA interferase family [Micromonospora siamensis]